MISPSVRIRILMVIFLAGGAVIFLRLFTWQVLRSDTLTATARSQQQTSTTLDAKRGSIFASDGFPLVSSKEAWLVWASVPNLKDTATVSNKLAGLFIADEKISEVEGCAEQCVLSDSAKIREKILTDEKDRIKKLLTRENAVWVPIKHRVSKEVKEQVESLRFTGIGFDPEETREYPEASMAARLLGFVGKDEAGEDRGYFGLEGYYDLTLSGSRGAWAWERDAFGNPIVFGNSRKVTAMNGMNLKTTLDRTVQFIVEKHLTEGVAKYNATDGIVVVLRPQDGAVLASASIPAYDPSRFSGYKKEQFTDPVIGESFEPGSIFKVLVMASALDAGAVDTSSKCDRCTGPRTIAEYTINSGSGQYYPDSTPYDIILHSDNVGMIWTAERLGADKFYDYISRFGIGSPTGVDLQGEASPPLRKKGDWSEIDLATASFGQGVAVTPIQMVRAVSAIANKGLLPGVHLVQTIESDGKGEQVRHKQSQRVVSEKAAKEITEMMTNAVDSRSDMWFKPKNIKVAGKTGTAQVPIAGHYDPNKTIASFVGFAPADDPKFVMIVTLRDPKAAPWASQTAAPLWFSIANDLFPYFKTVVK